MAAEHAAFSKPAPTPDTVMKEDISSRKFFQGQYFNELLNNDFILEAHSIFIRYHTRTIPLPDFSQQKTNPELQLRNEPSALGSSNGTGHSSLTRPRLRDLSSMTEGGVGRAPLHLLLLAELAAVLAPTTLYRGKDAHVPAQLKGLFMPLR